METHSCQSWPLVEEVDNVSLQLNYAGFAMRSPEEGIDPQMGQRWHHHHLASSEQELG